MVKKTGLKLGKKNNKIMEERRLYLSSTDSVIGGVCGGIAEYLNVDSVWLRLLFVLLAFAGGSAILLYIIFWIIMPQN